MQRRHRIRTRCEKPSTAPDRGRLRRFPGPLIAPDQGGSGSLPQRDQGLPATPPPRGRRPGAAAAGAGVTDPHEGRRQGGRAGPDSGRRARSRESPSPRRRRIAPPAHRGEACNPAPRLGISVATEPLSGEARAAAPLDRVQPGLAGTGEPRLDDGEPPRRLGLPRRPIARRPGEPARRRCQRRATLAPDRRQLREIVHGGTGYQAWSRSAPGAATRSTGLIGSLDRVQ